MNAHIRTGFTALVLALAAVGGVAHGADTPGGAATAPQQPPAVSTQPGMPQGGAAGSADSMAGAQAGNAILNMKAGEISGREVYNTQGRELGKVDMVGRDRTTGALSAIVSVGGFLGFGGSKVAIPIEQLSFRDDKLILSTAMSKKELRSQASGYQSKRYEAVAEDTTLSQVAPTTGGAAAAGVTPPVPGGTSPQVQGQPQPQAPSAGTLLGSFQQLDRNQDGYLSRDEAARDPTVLGHWRQLDRNNDGRIDSSEFSAFEQGGASGGSEPRPSGDNMRSRQ